MADITVTSIIEIPGGGVPERASVQIQLVSGGDYGGFLSGQEILGTDTPVVDGNGAWTRTLKPNIGTGAITDPTSTKYRVTEWADGFKTVYCIQVDGSGAASVNASAIRIAC